MKIQPSDILIRRFDFAEGVFKIHVYHAWKICELINAEQPNFASRYVVNIGAGDGVSCNDPCYPLFQIGYSGLAVEGEDNKEIYENIPSENIMKITNFMVTPFNVNHLFNHAKVPNNFDFLKIDIDGYDGPVLESILMGGYRPKIIQVEINPEIPPPIEFSVMYSDMYKVLDEEGSYSGFYGMSLCYAARLMRYYGYHLIYLDNVTPFAHDAVFVRNDISGILGSDPNMTYDTIRKAYFSHPPAQSHFKRYGIDSAEWRKEENVNRLVNSVWSGCIKSSVKKFNGMVYPFFFSVMIE